MRGVINSRDILMHGPTILWNYGPRVFLRSLMNAALAKPCTFLDVVFDADGVRKPGENPSV